MKPGSVIVDLAAEQGGNCPLTKADEVIEVHGVTIMGYTNLPSRLAVDTSSLYARNLFNFVQLDRRTRRRVRSRSTGTTRSSRARG